MQLDINNIGITHTEPKSMVFVSGLARAGTTKVLNELYKANLFYSLTYANFPFALMPRFWHNASNSENEHLRAHNDNIYVTSNSPEAIEEVFWKTILPEYYSKSYLPAQTITNENLNTYFQYINSFNNSDKIYLAKNNNLLLRLSSFSKKLNNAKYIYLFREPTSHAASLLNMHKRFVAMQQQDNFVLEYMDYLGHYEFGMHHKPFFMEQNISHDLYSIDYWISIWEQYYRKLIEINPKNSIYISFDNLTRKPNESINRIFRFLDMNNSVENLLPYDKFSNISTKNQHESSQKIYIELLNLERQSTL